MLVNKHFTNLGCLFSKSKRYYNVKPSACCSYMMTKILTNFHI